MTGFLMMQLICNTDRWIGIDKSMSIVFSGNADLVLKNNFDNPKLLKNCQNAQKFINLPHTKLD